MPDISPQPGSSLLDAVKAGSNALTTPGTAAAGTSGLNPTTGEQTQQVANLTATAQTGKDLAPATGGGSRLSAVGEKLASLSTLIGAKQIQTQSDLTNRSAEQQSAGMEQAQQASLAQVTQQRVDMQQDFNNKVSGMMQDQRLNLQQLDLNKDKARLEQLGTQLRLGNQQYIDKLQTEATKARLDNSVEFNEQIQRTVFSDEESLFANNLTFRSIVKANDRDSEKALANIDIDFALAMAASSNAAANASGMWSGVGNATAAGLGAAAQYKSSPSNPGTGESADTGALGTNTPANVPSTESSSEAVV